ncbi:MAG TPA: polysaccharide biosynthesis tyrosine autokinase [Xanthomonadaceae bacterium]|jgi:capsular exopolysaccharide synthesis family protein
MQDDDHKPEHPEGDHLPAGRHHPIAVATPRQDRPLALDLREAERAPPDAGAIDLRHYWRILMRRKWTVLAALGIVFFTVLVATLMQTPIYRATTTIQIDRDTPQVLQVEGMNTSNSMGYVDDNFYPTQYELLRSLALSQRVAAQLHLARDPDFQHLGAPTAMARLASTFLHRGKVQAKATLTDADSAALGGYVNAGLDIEPIKDTRLVLINFDSASPDLASRVANAVADNFIAANLEHSFNSSAYARQYLEQRLAQLKQKLEDSEKELVAVAAQEKIFTGIDGKATLPAENLAALNASLATAQDARISAEARWKLASSTSGEALPGDVANMAGGSIVAQLRQNRSDLMAQYQEKLGTYKPNYPVMLALKGRIDDLDRQIATEYANIKAAAKSNYESAKAREDLLKSQMDQLKGQVLDQQTRSVRYGTLQRDVNTNQQLYDALLQRYKEIGIAGGVTSNNMSVVDRATVPGGPYKPNLRNNLMMATFFGLLLGAGLAIFFDHLDDTLKTAEDIETQLRLAVLGVVPRSRELSPLEALKDQRSGVAEAYRSVRTALQFSTDSGVPRTLLVTSATPAEGKSTTAIALARNFAQLGKRVLLIDADLRNPSLHRSLAIDNATGLSNVLSGAANPQDVIRNLPDGSLQVMTSGPLPPDPAELLAGSKMLSLLTVALAKYDQVVLDGPPTMGIADAVILAHIVKGTLLIVEAGGTRRDVALGALKRLTSARAHVLGALLTKFDARTSGYYYHYDHYYYDYKADDGQPAKLEQQS